MLKRVCLIFIIIFFSINNSYTQTDDRGVRVKKKNSKKRIALVIGNGAYKNSPLRNPVNDARDIASVLKAKGFKVSLYLNADQRKIKNAVREFGKKLRLGGVGLFYYAGHGMQVKGVNYLIPINSGIKEEDEVEFEGVNANRVLSKMESAGNDMNIIILDACRDNPFRRNFRSGSRGLARMDVPKGTLIVYATSPGKTAADGKGRNGVFTKHLLKTIKNKNLEISQLLKVVRKGVIDETNSKQVPWESSSIIGDFYFGTILKKPVKKYKPNLPTKSNLNLIDIELEAKLLEKEKLAWEIKLYEFKSAVEKGKGIDGNKNISVKSKITVWQRIFYAFGDNNKYSTEDERLRTYVRKRIEYWKNQQGKLNKKKEKKLLSKFHSEGIRLRSIYKNLTKTQAKSMIKKNGFSDIVWNKNGSFSNVFLSKKINGDKVVIDKATDLMWHQSGSSKGMTWFEAWLWVKDLNHKGYAGYDDWRIPTLEEGMSLLKSSKSSNGLYIDSLFNKKQWVIWTGDEGGANHNWYIWFERGYVNINYKFIKYYIRPVRTINKPLTPDNSNKLIKPGNKMQENEKKKKLNKNISPQRIFAKQAKRIKYVKPIYPRVASEASINGIVRIEVTTDVLGKVVSWRILSGHRLLNNAAINAVKQWKYEPYLIDGVPIPVCFTISINFVKRNK